MYAMEAAYWPDLFTAMYSSLSLLARLRAARSTLSLLTSWDFPSTSTQNDEVYIAAGEPIEQGG